MRSAETSDARTTSLGASDKSEISRWFAAHKLLAAADALKARFSPVSFAVFGTALFAALIFVATDTMRTLDDTSARIGMFARIVAEEIAPLDADVAGPALARKVAALDPHLRATLVPGVVTSPSAPNQISAQAGAGPRGTLVLNLDLDTALSGVWQRGWMALALALILTGMTLARGKRGASGMAGKEHVRLHDFLLTLPFGVACWTDTGKLIACNGQYQSEIMEDDRVQVSTLTYQGAVKKLMAGGYVRMVREGTANRLLELHRQDGSCLLIDERPIAEGGFVTLVTDITDHKRAETMLNSIQEEQKQLARRYHEEKLRAEAASTAKTSFLAHLSHDIRTPLNHIIGFAELIGHQTYGPLGDRRYLDYVETIKTSGERLLSSFATILDLAELESGRTVLRTDTFGVNDLTGAIERRFREQAQRAGLRLTVTGPCEATLTGDRYCLERMLGNLVENAIRFTPAGGRVAIGAYAASDGVVLEISDTGIGMTEDRLATLSQPFAFGDAAFAREHEGAGLGIAIARAIAELSGGRLAIDSSPALGTTVAVSLPRLTPVSAHAA